MISFAINFHGQTSFFLLSWSDGYKSSNKNASSLLSLSSLIDEKEGEYGIEYAKSGSGITLQGIVRTRVFNHQIS